MWKLCIFVSGGYSCLRCGSHGSFYDLKKRLGDLPDITNGSGTSIATNTYQESPVLRTTDVQEWITNLQDNTEVLTYLTETRGLSLNVLRKYHVGVKTHKFLADMNEWVEHTCIMFPWTIPTSVTSSSNVIYTRAKLRSIQDKACMRLIPKGGDWGFFGWHLIPSDAKEIIITEGEFDAMAVYQSTGIPAISLPNGCRSLPPQLLPCLERFEKIVLWLDDDVAGHEALDNIVNKLGMSRCYIVQGGSGAKDANEALLKNMNIMEMLENAKPLSHKQIAQYSELKNEVYKLLTNPDLHVGAPYTHMPKLQSLMKGHRKGELTIITGGTGVGKTTILSQLSIESALHGVPTLWGSFEIRNPRLIRTMLRQYSALLGYTLTPESMIENFAYLSEKFEELPFYFLKFYGSSPVEEIIEAMEYAVYVHDVQHVILDNLQFMLSGQNRNNDKFDIQDRAIEAFRQFASQRNVHVTLVIHPRKEADNTSLGLASVFGSAKATQEADNVLIIQGGLPRTITKPLGLEKGGKSKQPDMSTSNGFDDPLVGEILATNFRTLELRKNRWDGDLGSVPLKFDKASGRLYELSNEDIQTGLVEYVEEEKKKKQLELIKHMNNSNTSKTNLNKQANSLFTPQSLANVKKTSSVQFTSYKKLEELETQVNTLPPQQQAQQQTQTQTQPQAETSTTSTDSTVQSEPMVSQISIETPSPEAKPTFKLNNMYTSPPNTSKPNKTIVADNIDDVNFNQDDAYTEKRKIPAPPKTVTPPKLHKPSLDIICE